MKFTDFLGKLINIHPGEWRRLIILYSMAFIAVTGLTWGDAIVQGAFLQYVGVRYLPLLLIGTACLSIISLFIYSAFADRVSHTRVLIGLLAISGIGILLGIGLLTVGIITPAYVLIYLILNAPLFDVFNIHWATYANGFFNIRAAKRIVPVLSTGGRLAGIISGLSMSLMTKAMSPAAIICVSVACMAYMGAMAAAMPRLLHEPQGRNTRAGKTQVAASIAAPGESSQPKTGGSTQSQQFARAYSARLREGYEQIVKSPFLKWMAISTFCLPILLVMLNYAASTIFQAELKTTVAIADFLGVLSGVSNLVILPFQLFFLSRLITRLGLGKSNLIYPFASLASAGSIAIAPGLATAAFAYLDRTALRTAFKSPIENLLYNAVPARVKARTRAFVGGLVVPIGSILSSLLLLTPLVDLPLFLPTGIVLVGLFFVAASLKVRKNYTKALVDLLEDEDYSSLALQAPVEQAPASFAMVDAAGLTRLEQKLRESTSPERAVFLAQIITSVGGEEGVKIVGQAAQATADRRLRAVLLDVLVSAEVRQTAAREVYTQFLSDPDGNVRLSAISGLEQLYGTRDSRYLDIAGKMLGDPDYEVRLYVLPALIAADDQSRASAGAAELRALLNAPGTNIRAKALQRVRQARIQGFLPEVARLLTDPEGDVRLAAALAAEELVNNKLPLNLQNLQLIPVLNLLQDPIERIRLAAVSMLGQHCQNDGLDFETVSSSLVAVLGDPSPVVRERAVEILSGVGRGATPLVNEQLASEDPLMRKMAAVVLASIDPRKYSALVRVPHIDNNLQVIYRNLCCYSVLTKYSTPAVTLLRRALLEQNTKLIDETFNLLAVIQDPEAITTIATSLRSMQPQVRANAAEALESLTTPKITALIAPLYELDLSSQALIALAKQTWGISAPTPAAAFRLVLASNQDAWQRTLATAALIELITTDGLISVSETAEVLALAKQDLDEGVRAEINTRIEPPADTQIETTPEKTAKPSQSLTLVEKLILLADAPFFQSLSIDQLRVLAPVCVEEHFPAGAHIYECGDTGGVFYIVVSGRVGIKQENRKGVFTRIATVESHAYLGETDFFDNNARTNSAIAIQDTLTLRLRREPLITLARQHPDLSLELIRVLSTRLREANERITELTRAHPQKLNRLFDQLE